MSILNDKYHSFYLVSMKYLEIFELYDISRSYMNLVCNKFKFTFPKSTPMRRFVLDYIIPMCKFIENTFSFDLINSIEKCELNILDSNDYTLCFKDRKSMGNHGNIGKIHMINIRDNKGFIITLFHELIHVIDTIKDKYMIRLEKALLPYELRNYERRAFALSLIRLKEYIECVYFDLNNFKDLRNTLRDMMHEELCLLEKYKLDINLFYDHHILYDSMVKCNRRLRLLLQDNIY